MPDLGRRLAAELVGSVFLLAAVVGSGIMAERLAGGNVALALLANAVATGAMLYVLIVQLGPISGAHLNPAVTLVAMLRRDLPRRDALFYVAVQLCGAVSGVLIAHLMFDLPLLQISAKARSGPSQWFAETVAAFGLVMTVLATAHARRDAVPMAVALYITAAYWFTASTSFANPAVTIARSLSDSFSGIRPIDVPAFVIAQVVGALAAAAFCRRLLRRVAGRK